MIVRQILVSLAVYIVVSVLIASGALHAFRDFLINKLVSAARSQLINRLVPESILSLGFLYLARDYVAEKTRLAIESCRKRFQ